MRELHSFLGSPAAARDKVAFLGGMVSETLLQLPRVSPSVLSLIWHDPSPTLCVDT